MNASVPPGRWRLAPVAALAVTLLACLATRAADTPAPAPARALTSGDPWSLRLPPQDKPAFQGVVSFDNAGRGAGAMVYPAPNLIAFLASVAVHAAIESNTQGTQRTEIQVAADKVLQPYQPVIDGLSVRALLEQAIVQSSVPGTKRIMEFVPGAQLPRGPEWVIESQPVFSMTQDETALVLDHLLVIHSPDDKTAEGRASLVRVISPIRSAPSMAEFWNANQGENLKREVTGLLTESLNLALGETAALSVAPSTGDIPQKTIRYALGGAEKMERAQVLQENCERLVIKTLRGGLMSVPRRGGALPPGCAAAAPAPAAVGASESPVMPVAAP